MLFYGCGNDGAGHFLFRSNGRKEYSSTWNKIDGKFVPTWGDERTLVLSQFNGATVLSMVDFSVDTRPGSNANFIEGGEHTLEEMKAMAVEQFPHITKRLKAFQEK